MLTWFDGERWRNVEACASWVGEKYVVAPSPYSTAMNHQANTLEWSYDGPRAYGYAVYTPSSRNHEITVRAKPSTPSNVRFTDPYGYDNSQTGSPPGLITYALDTLWNFATSFLLLPFPSPWGLLLLGEGSELTITRDSDLRGGRFEYNARPDLQGADWLWYIEKPVNTGWYHSEITGTGEAGYDYYHYMGGSAFIKERDIILYLNLWFLVTRS